MDELRLVIRTTDTLLVIREGCTPGVRPQPPDESRPSHCLEEGHLRQELGLSVGSLGFKV